MTENHPLLLKSKTEMCIEFFMHILALIVKNLSLQIIPNKNKSVNKVFFFVCVAVSVSSPIVPGGMRNIHDNKVSCQVSGNSNHNARHCSNDEYISIVQRLANDVSTCQQKFL